MNVRFMTMKIIKHKVGDHISVLNRFSQVQLIYLKFIVVIFVTLS